MDSFLIHYVRIHSTHCHARTHKVRACSFKEKSLEITQAEFKVEIQQHKEFEDSGICFYPELEIEVESNRHYRIFHFTAWKKKFTQCEVFCIPEYCCSSTAFLNTAFGNQGTQCLSELWDMAE